MSREDQAIAYPLHEIVIGIERQEAGTAGGNSEGAGKAGQYNDYVFPIVPNRALETGTIEEQRLPNDNDGKDTGYFSNQDSRKSPKITGDKRDRDIDGSLYPCRPSVVIIAITCIKQINCSTREHDKSIQ